MAKRERADGLFDAMTSGERTKPKPRVGQARYQESYDTRNDSEPPAEVELSAFTVRLPAHLKARLEDHLWRTRGERLAAGVRRILVEHIEGAGLL